MTPTSRKWTTLTTPTVPTTMRTHPKDYSTLRWRAVFAFPNGAMHNDKALMEALKKRPIEFVFAA